MYQETFTFKFLHFINGNTCLFSSKRVHMVKKKKKRKVAAGKCLKTNETEDVVTGYRSRNAYYHLIPCIFFMHAFSQTLQA